MSSKAISIMIAATTMATAVCLYLGTVEDGYLKAIQRINELSVIREQAFYDAIDGTMDHEYDWEYDPSEDIHDAHRAYNEINDAIQEEK